MGINYKKELSLLFKELGDCEIRIPGDFKGKKVIEVLKKDYDELEELL